MKHFVGMFFALGLLWLLLSTYFQPLLLGFGVFSVLLTIWIVHRMDVIDHESRPLHLTRLLPKFWVLLFWEIIKSNIDVVLQVLGVRPISPTLSSIALPQKTDLGRVIYANAITLTPGTVSIELNPEQVLVHTLSTDAADELRRGYLASIVPEIGELS